MLVVEDNDVNALIAVSYLDQLGVTTTRVPDGRHGVEAAFATPRPDLILMDCRMPVLDGGGDKGDSNDRTIDQQGSRPGDRIDGEPQRRRPYGVFRGRHGWLLDEAVHGLSSRKPSACISPTCEKTERRRTRSTNSPCHWRTRTPSCSVIVADRCISGIWMSGCVVPTMN